MVDGVATRRHDTTLEAYLAEPAVARQDQRPQRIPLGTIATSLARAAAAISEPARLCDYSTAVHVAALASGQQHRTTRMGAAAQEGGGHRANRGYSARS